MTDQLLTTLEDGVLTVTFNRPEKKNALTLAMYRAATEAITRAEDEAAIKVVVFIGAGDMFTSGNDIGDFLSIPPDSADSPVVQFLLKLVSTDIPLLAAVHGRAVGIGTTMLMHCEKVYAAEETLFSTPFINLAVVPEAASSLLMPKFLGYQRAASLLLFGESMDSVAALDCGLLSAVCPADQLLATVMADAARIARLPKKAMRQSKRLMKRSEEPLQQRVEEEMAVFGRALASAESKEAMSAFMEKRPADFSKFD